MITGYNNDIKRRGTVFHVQTEDKGETSAWIESLIYTGGRILARKRVTYKQLLDDGADKPAISKLMERQHRLMIHQIREGRFDGETSDGIEPGKTPPEESDAKIHTTRIQQQAEAMFAPTAAGDESAESSAAAEAKPQSPSADLDLEGRETAAEEPDSVDDALAVGADEAEAAQEAESDVEQTRATEEAPIAEAEAEAVDLPPAVPGDAEPIDEETAVDVPSDEVPIADAPAGPAATGPAPVEQPTAAATDEFDDEVEVEVGPAPTLDQVIFDYLSSVAQEESLVLLMDESPALATGTTTRMDLGTHASRSGKPIANAVIAVRMISKTGGPVTLAEGSTDEDGTLRLVVEVPEVERDTAALIITAASSIGNAEIKHLL